MLDRCECHDEVARLHRFFQDWYRGDLDVDEFSACEQALAPGFTIITPSGEIIDRARIVDAIRRHRGGEPDHFEIRTVPRSCQRLRGLHISTYEEHQNGTRSTIRVSTAVIDGSLRWHNVHETWMTTTEL